MRYRHSSGPTRPSVCLASVEKGGGEKETVSRRTARGGGEEASRNAGTG